MFPFVLYVSVDPLYVDGPIPLVKFPSAYTVKKVLPYDDAAHPSIVDAAGGSEHVPTHPIFPLSCSALFVV